ncbi:Uma2 family endonuclease [Nocardia sp. NPDC051321]|uniref:Uma2 family endonuclease n=1 Tax=Nocardia sp. NPDC051321 TaxID=3364323 RepID=UPI0037B9B4FD
MVEVRGPLMSTAEFEELAQAAYRIGDGLRLEFIGGTLSAKPPPNGNHSCVIAWLTRLFLLNRPELWLSSAQGLLVGSDRTGRARPDGTLADAEAFVGQAKWADADLVLMAVEVASPGEDTNRRHRTEKPRAYAATGIPVYLLIDRAAHEVAVYSGPSAGRYQRIVTMPFGAEVLLPEPVSITLDTAPLAQWAA